VAFMHAPQLRGESEMKSRAWALIRGRPHSPSISLHDRTGDGQPHPGPLWFRRMKRIKNRSVLSASNPTPVSLMETIR
jgi:hypothetical protein